MILVDYSNHHGHTIARASLWPRLPSGHLDCITDQMEPTVLLAHVADLARRAGAAILAIRARGFDVVAKSDKTPVTAADHAAEAVIVEALRSLTPDIPVVAEEEVAAGRITPAAAAYWLVDPLDGTREFAAGRDEFTVNIGLVREGKPVLGVVGVPAYGEMFGGTVGQYAWKRTSAGETRIHTRAAPRDGLAVLASRSHVNDERLQKYLKGRFIASVTNIGSGLKFCRLAEGAADLYPRFGRTMEWDTAAPQAVLEAAGGSVTLFDGSPLTYGKPDWVNPPFVCCGQ